MIRRLGARGNATSNLTRARQKDELRKLGSIEQFRFSKKKKSEWPLHSGWAGPGATFSGLSLSGPSHNDCRRWALTKRSVVRILFGEPNYLTTNSLPFWLTARRHGLAGNGQYCAKGLSPVRQLDRYPPPDLARWPHSRAPFSVSPITSACLVNCQAGSGRAGGSENASTRLTRSSVSVHGF